jgi:hypothetical protein
MFLALRRERPESMRVAHAKMSHGGNRALNRSYYNSHVTVSVTVSVTVHTSLHRHFAIMQGTMAGTLGNQTRIRTPGAGPLVIPGSFIT